MSENTLRTDGNRCFVCGPENADGLRLEFRMDDDVCRSEFVPEARHVGYDEVVHGGIVFAVLDDVMANWLYLAGERAFTARCEIRYRQPARVGEQLLLEGRLLKRKGRMAVLQGEARRASDGELVASTEATFMVDSGA